MHSSLQGSGAYELNSVDLNDSGFKKERPAYNARVLSGTVSRKAMGQEINIRVVAPKPIISEHHFVDSSGP